MCYSVNIDFKNKLDRYGKEPLDLLDEIEKVLGIGSCPLNWPVRLSTGDYGLYDRNRLKSEYGVDVVMSRLPYQLAHWVKEPPSSLGGFMVKDEDGNSVILYDNDFSLEWAKRRNPSVTFYALEELPSDF